MAKALDNNQEIKDSDIVFDCPHCGKSLAIDYKGAGLTIPCTDCGKNVIVPIPTGLELSDIDGSEEQREISLLSLRKSLMTSEKRCRELEQQVKDLAEECDRLMRAQTDAMYQFAAILEKVGVAQKAVNDITGSLDAITDIAQGEKPD